MKIGTQYIPRRTKDVLLNQNLDDISRSIGALSKKIEDKVDKDTLKTFLANYFLPGTVSIGNPLIDGSWRFYDSGTDLVVERREAGAWVEKGRFLA